MHQFEFKGDVSEADRLLDLARSLGEDNHLCLLQKAQARIERAREEKASKSRTQLSKDADDVVKEADLGNPREYRDPKHQTERKRLLDQVRQMAKPKAR